MLECIRFSSKKLDKIKISQRFKNNPPKPEKLIQKTADFVKGEKLSTIYVDENYYLVDGYCSYLIVKALGSNKVKIKQIKVR